MTQSTSIPEYMSGMIQQPAVVETTEVEIKERVTVEGLASLLVALSSSLANLYLQSHLIHLNVEGPLFLPVHEFLKDQYEAHVGQLDKTGELKIDNVFTVGNYTRPLADQYENSDYLGG